MVLVRRFDREANALQRQGQLGIWVPLLGQEAAQIGAGRAMQPQDMAFPSYREHGVAWTRGVDPTELLGIFRGTDQGGWDPTAAGFHLYTIVIGNQCLNATGYAMGQRFEGERSGDGRPTGRQRGDHLLLRRRRHQPGRRARGFRVGRRLRRARRLLLPEQPVGDLRAAPSGRAGCRSTSGPAGYGFPGIRVDGNDVLACLAVTRWALEECRTGNGPVLIEAFTYRMDAHTTSDDPTRYRLADELELWKLKDPIERVRVNLVREHDVEQEFFDGMQAESDELAARFRQFCVDMPPPAPDRMFSQVYAEGSPGARRAARRQLPGLPRVLRGGPVAMMATR